MKHILIPTDFSITSLNAVGAALHKYDNEYVRFTLFHLMSMPYAISELLLFRRIQHRYENKVSDEFYEACQVLQNKFGKTIAEINIKFAFGGTSSFLKNFIEANNADHIVLLKELNLGKPFKESIAIKPLLKRAKIPFEELSDSFIDNQLSDINLINMKTLKKRTFIVQKTAYVTEE